MAKRKEAATFTFKPIDASLKENPQPPCYNEREDYCRPQLCGQWFENCQLKGDSKEITDDFVN